MSSIYLTSATISNRRLTRLVPAKLLPVFLVAAMMLSFAASGQAALVLRLDASEITGLSDGDAVTNWLDTSGQSNHAVKGPNPNSPVYVANAGPNGNLPVVRFDPNNPGTPLISGGTHDGLSLTNNINLSPSFSIFALVRRGTGDNFIMGGFPSPATNQQIRILPNSHLLVYDGNSAIATDPLTTPMSDYLLVEYINDNGNYSFFENGQSLGTVGGGNNITLGTVGGFWYDRNGFNGDIASLLVYDTALDAAERLAVETSLLAQLSGAGPSVPEPTTATLGLIGLAGLLVRRRRAA